MRKKIIVANWKMNNTLSESLLLIDNIKHLLHKQSNRETKIVIAPPFPFIQQIADKIKDIDNCSVAAQNCHWKDKGAFTGEVSTLMLQSLGVQYVIIGHSERRSFFNEDNNLLSKKISIAQQNRLIPIYCCGEQLEERQKENQFAVVSKQIEEGIFHLSEKALSHLVIAYEPVWAIGTGITATTTQAQEMHAFIRSLISSRYNKSIAEQLSILYGGSCNPSNAKELFDNPDVDGGLIGGASLVAKDFVAIINSAE